jgi:LuxR family transcriptional regulator, maltose regulon positive regulatory protein
MSDSSTSKPGGEPGSPPPHEQHHSPERPILERPLTDREMEILQCLPTRLSTNEIGEVLHISPNTVKTHLRSIYSKLSARSRNEAILQGAKYRLISKDSEWLVRH